jgi:hypothetical protein
LLNDEAVTKSAEAFATQVLRSSDDDDARVVYAFLTAFGRRPTPNEAEAARTFLRDFRGLKRAERAPETPQAGRRRPRLLRSAAPKVDVEKETWTAFCQSLYGSAEFRSVD